MASSVSDASASPDPAVPYVVVARRYRPRSFDELVGQEHITRALVNAIETGRVGHAYLFTGARGVGKTSTARIFAKALNAPEGPTPYPDNDSDICRAIDAGEDMDVIEIDGASNRGIEEIRQLRANVNVRPSRARYKIYIIDEVHMLTSAAFNALLKTLEEPPEHVKFIFCTTDPQKIPITVRSRCQRFDFAPIDVQAICERLAYVVETEGRSADPEALRLLAQRAEGSMRDSQSLLEQLLAFCEGTIRVEDVHQMLGTASSGRLAGLIERVARHDAAGALELLDQAVREGVDCGQLAEQLLGYLRDMMVLAVGGTAELLRHCSASDQQPLRTLAGQLGVETLLAMTQILDQTLVRMRQSVQPRVLLEVALVRLCNLENLEPLCELIDQLKSGALPAEPQPQAAGVPSRSSAPDRPVSGEKKKAVVATAQPSSAPPASVGSGWNTRRAAALWKQAIETLEDMTADMASFFDHVTVPHPDTMVVHFPARYTLQKDACEQPERKQQLEAALARLAGRAIRVNFALMPAEDRTREEASKTVSLRQLMREKQSHPWVQRAIELFDAEVVRVDPARKG